MQKCNWFAVMLVVTYSQSDGVKFKDASL